MALRFINHWSCGMSWEKQDSKSAKPNGDIYHHRWYMSVCSREHPRIALYPPCIPHVSPRLDSLSHWTIPDSRKITGDKWIEDRSFVNETGIHLNNSEGKAINRHWLCGYLIVFVVWENVLLCRKSFEMVNCGLDLGNSIWTICEMLPNFGGVRHWCGDMVDNLQGAPCGLIEKYSFICG